MSKKYRSTNPSHFHLAFVSKSDKVLSGLGLSGTSPKRSRRNRTKKTATFVLDIWVDIAQLTSPTTRWPNQRSNGDQILITIVD